MPFFGICFGMQMAVIEAARHLAGLPNASSTEFGPCDEAVVGLLTEWARGNEREKREQGGDLGGTMRLGAYTRQSSARARWCANSTAARRRSWSGIAIASRSTSTTATGWRLRDCASAACRRTEILPETVELPGHPWFVGVQYHPELKSKPLDPHPLFRGFIEAAVKQARLV